MKKMIGVTLLAISSLLSTISLASGPYTFQSGATVDYALPANEPQVFSNVFMWPVAATCKIITQQEKNPVVFRVLRKTGSVNDVKMSIGDTITLLFNPNDVVHIRAEAGGKVELLNLGTSTISARCTSES